MNIIEIKTKKITLYAYIRKLGYGHYELGPYTCYRNKSTRFPPEQIVGWDEKVVEVPDVE